MNISSKYNKKCEYNSKSDIYCNIAIYLYLFYVFYYSLFGFWHRQIIEFLLLFFSVIFGMLSLFTESKQILIKKSFCKYMIGWLLIIFFFFIFRNWWLSYSVWSTIRWLWGIFIAFCLSKSDLRINNHYKSIIIIGFPHVIATIYFLFFKNAYSVMYKFFGQWPSGTVNGRYGFRAGLANHYSLNGIYLAIVFLGVFSITLHKIRKQQKNKIFFWIVLTILTSFALVLSMKRAHILFSVITIVLGFFFYNRHISARQIIIVLWITTIISLATLWIYKNIPEINIMIERFENLGTDGNSTFRIKMWKDALIYFENNPIFGIGWGGFRLFSGYDMNAHNVYIQLLAETGIVGFCIYIFSVSKIFTFLRKETDYISLHDVDDDTAIMCLYSFLICTFYLLYSLSGNCLFDVTFNFFVIPISSAYLYMVYKKNLQ